MEPPLFLFWQKEILFAMFGCRRQMIVAHVQDHKGNLYCNLAFRFKIRIFKKNHNISMLFYSFFVPHAIFWLLFIENNISQIEGCL
jgi:hypothetical protein